MSDKKMVHSLKKAVEETKEGKNQYDFWHPKGDRVTNGKKLYFEAGLEQVRGNQEMC